MSELLAAVNSSQKRLAVDSLPTSQYIEVGSETMKILTHRPTAIGFSVRVERGAEETTAASHSLGAAVTPLEQVFTAGS